MAFKIDRQVIMYSYEFHLFSNVSLLNLYILFEFQEEDPLIAIASNISNCIQKFICKSL